MATKAEKLLAKGRSLEAKGRREKALEVYRDACRVEPYDPDLWTARADAARAMGLRGEAAEALFHVCDLFARGGLPTQALPVVKKVLELEPSHGGARRLLSVLEKRLAPDDPPPPAAILAAAASTPSKDPAPPVEEPPPVTVPPPVTEPPAQAEDEPPPIQEPPTQPKPEPPRPSAEPPTRAGHADAGTEPVAAADAHAPMDTRAAAATDAVTATDPVAATLMGADTATNGATAATAPPPAAAASPTPHAESSAIPEPLPHVSTTPLTDEDLEPDVVEVAAAPAPRPTPPPRRSGTSPPVPPSTPPASPRPSLSGEHHAIGNALDEILLAERLPSSILRDSGTTEIVLDEDGQIDVVHAVASTLTTSPLLSELDSDLVRHLIDCGKLVHRTSQDHVFRQGDPGTSLYLILSGEVAVVYENRQKHVSRELARLRAGAFFGEMALLTNTPRSASVVAVKNSDFLEISRKSVRDLIDREPRVLKLLMRFFRARLVGTLLQTAPLFKPFTRDERRDLIGRFRLRELAAEHTVIAEGAGGEGLFIVLVGRLEVLQSLASSHRKGSAGGDGLSVLLGTLAPGDVFGEMSLLDEAPAMATVRTRTRTWVLLLPRPDFEGVAKSHPQIRSQLEDIAATRRERNRAAEDTRELRVEPV